MAQDTVAAFLANSENTHAPGVQASAARLILLLREAFTDGEAKEASTAERQTVREVLTKALAPQPPEEALSAPLARPQASGSTPLQPIENIAISGILEFLTAVHALPDADKRYQHRKEVLEYILKVVFGKKDHWTQNSIYNEQTNSMSIVTASVRETLNLVCLATLEPSPDREDRIDTLFQCLLDRHKQPKTTCFAWHQHTILFTLNGWREFYFIEDTAASLSSSIHYILEEQLTASHPDLKVRQKFLLNWLKHSITPVPEVEAWLSAQSKELPSRVKSLFKTRGLNPEEPQLKGLIEAYCSYDALQYMSPPLSNNSDGILVRDILNLQPTTGTAGDRKIVESRNRSLEYTKTLIMSTDDLDPIIVQLRHFAVLEDTLRLLVRHQKIFIFMQIEALRWQEARTEGQGETSTDPASSSQHLPELLLELKTAMEADFNTFCSQPAETQRTTALHQLMERASTALEIFHREHDVELIQNLFVLLTDATPESTRALLGNLYEKRDQYLLTDELLLEWYNQQASQVGDATVITLSPYEINRIFLHAVFTDVKNWTESFQMALTMILDWFQKEELSKVESSVQSAYPKQMLANLRLCLLLSRMQNNDRFLSFIPQTSNDVSAFCQKMNMIYSSRLFYRFLMRNFDTQRQNELLEVLQPHALQLIQNAVNFVELLNILPGATQLIWKLAEGKLADLIQNADQLASLLSCSHLTEVQRSKIWEFAADKLGALIQDADQLERLLSCSYLTEDHRSKIWASVAGKLGALIQDANQLRYLLDCSHLTEDQRSNIWASVAGKLGALIQDADQLRSLLYCRYLTEDQRSNIWESVTDKLGHLIQNAYQLRDLLDCSHLTEVQRSNIWESVADKLGHLIQDANQLRYLLDCSHLTEVQRSNILESVADKLDHLIQNAFQLALLLNCSYLTEVQRSNIWESVASKLGALIQNANQLRLLLDYSHLREVQRSNIWASVADKLGALIQDAGQLRYLLDCSHLREVQRSNIWASVADKLGDLIQNADQLASLLSCSHLTEDQRSNILASVADKLGALIQDAYQLSSLLNCSHLTKVQRSNIWASVSHTLGYLIQNAGQLESLSNCSYLTDNQRNNIWASVSHKLGDLIQYADQLKSLLNCSYLTEVQRSNILASVAGKLGDLIQNANQLRLLLDCSHLTEVQRSNIWASVSHKLGDLIQDADQLKSLLNCSRLTEVQRSNILASVAGKLGALIQDAVQLKALLDCDHLTKDQRSNILEFVSHKLGNLIEYPRQLKSLLNCSHLTEVQRSNILDSVSHKLGDLIQDADQLESLLNCSYLIKDQRSEILPRVAIQPAPVMNPDQANSSVLRYSVFSQPVDSGLDEHGVQKQPNNETVFDSF